MHELRIGRPRRARAVTGNGVGALQEHERFLLRRGADLACVLRIVEPDREERPRNSTGGSHADLLLGDQAAIVEPQPRPVGCRRQALAPEDDARPLHAPDSPCRVLGHQPVLEAPDAVDLDRHEVARFRERRVLRDTDGQQVPGAKRHELRNVRDQAGDIAMQVCGRIAHPDLAVDPDPDAERIRRRQGVARDHPRAHGTEPVAALEAQRWTEETGVRNGDVVDDRIAGDDLAPPAPAVHVSRPGR